MCMFDLYKSQSCHSSISSISHKFFHYIQRRQYHNHSLKNMKNSCAVQSKKSIQNAVLIGRSLFIKRCAAAFSCPTRWNSPSYNRRFRGHAMMWTMPLSKSHDPRFTGKPCHCGNQLGKTSSLETRHLEHHFARKQWPSYRGKGTGMSTPSFELSRLRDDLLQVFKFFHGVDNLALNDF